MNLLEINPYIRLAMHSTLLAPVHINRRIIFDYELVYIESGEFTLMYNEREYICHEGDILFFCPGIPHSFHVLTTDLVQPHIHFDLKYDTLSEQVFVCFKDYDKLSPTELLLLRENAFPELKGTPFLKIGDKKAFLQVFYDIVNCELSSLNTLDCKAKMLYLLQRIISENASATFNIAHDNSRIAPLIKAYIDSNYTQSIQLAILEQYFGYSKFYIEKLFRQEYGSSVISYYNSKRMKKDVSLLKDHSVTETAQMLGFSSIYTFSRAFRSAYGVSPAKYGKDVTVHGLAVNSNRMHTK